MVAALCGLLAVAATAVMVVAPITCVATVLVLALTVILIVLADRRLAIFGGFTQHILERATL